MDDSFRNTHIFLVALHRKKTPPSQLLFSINGFTDELIALAAQREDVMLCR
ncbi:MAG: hypothetical protein RSC47_00475 [Raoultibacter sp.]